jgi:hypothetical protein
MKQMGPRLHLMLIAISVAVLLPTGTSGSESATTEPPVIDGCIIFPVDNIWNMRVDGLPVDPQSDAYVATIGVHGHVHADFGSGLWNGGPIGIRYISVDSDPPGVSVSFDYDEESDAGPYPIPENAPVEGGAQSDGDRHVLVLDRSVYKGAPFRFQDPDREYGTVYYDQVQNLDEATEILVAGQDIEKN